MFKRFFNKLSLKGFREELIANQRKQVVEIRRLHDQLFLNNPVLIIKDVKVYLPLFYVDHIQKIIFETKDYYEKETLNYLKNNFSSFENVLDVGSNIGNHMLFYCSELSSKKVVCFEPNEYNYSTLRQNVILNNLQHIVTIHNVALGESTGKAIQKDFSNTNTGMNRIEVADTANDATIDVKRLDDYGYQGIDFIKIDVEGFELQVLKGAGATLRASKAVVMIEVFEGSQLLVDEVMNSYGYKKMFTIEGYNSIYMPN